MLRKLHGLGLVALANLAARSGKSFNAVVDVLVLVVEVVVLECKIGKITKVLVMRIIVVLVLVSFC